MTGDAPRSLAATIARQVYLAAPIQARVGAGLSYEWFAQAIEAAGGAVINAEIAAPLPDDLDQHFAAPLICEANAAKLRSADVLVAECSVPSLGVGYEIAIAESYKIPVVCFWRVGATPLSKMILGSPYHQLRVFEYSTEEDIRQLMRGAFEALGTTENNHQCQDDYRTALLRYFDALAPDYDTTANWRRATALVSWFQSRLPSSGTVVDVGSGTGAIVSMAPPGLHVIRIDLSEAMLRRSDAGHAILADAHALPLPSAAVDAVTLRQVLHYTDEGACLSEVSRILRPGGQLLLGQIVASDDRTRRWWLEVKRMVQPLRRAFYTAPHLLGMLSSAGFVATERDTLELVRTDPWERFFANTPARFRPSVRDFLMRTPSDLCDSLDLQLSASGIRYRQRWCLMACEPHRSRSRR